MARLEIGSGDTDYAIVGRNPEEALRQPMLLREPPVSPVPGDLLQTLGEQGSVTQTVYVNTDTADGADGMWVSIVGSPNLVSLWNANDAYNTPQIVLVPVVGTNGYRMYLATAEIPGGLPAPGSVGAPAAWVPVGGDAADEVYETSDWSSVPPGSLFYDPTKDPPVIEVEGAGVLPPGGTTGQVLAKDTNTDYDTEWIDPPSTGLSQGAADALYVNITGDTMSGVLTASAGVVTPVLQGQGANNQLNMNGNWMPYSDGANYLNANYHVFRSLDGLTSSLTVTPTSVQSFVGVSITTNTTLTPNIVAKRLAGQTADILQTMNESGVVMPLAITADARLRLGYASLGEIGLNGIVMRGLQDGGKSTLHLTDVTTAAGYNLGVDHAAGWMQLHSASNLYLDGNAIYFRTSAYTALATWDTNGARFAVPVGIEQPTPAAVALDIKAAASQSANMMTFRNSAGTVLSAFDLVGRFNALGQVIYGLAAPGAGDHAANRTYVDARAVPAGGATGQVLTKSSNTDYAVAWAPSSGSGVTDHGALTGLADDDHPQYLPKTGGTTTGDIKTVRLGIRDNDATHHLFLVAGSNLTADRSLSLVTGDATRTLTISADVALNQSLLITSEPTFEKLHIPSTGAIALNGAPIRLKAWNDSVHQLYASDLSSTGPYMDGPVLTGFSGWAFHQSGTGVWRQGFRGGHTYPYAWVKGSMLVGNIAPDDAQITLGDMLVVTGKTKTYQVDSTRGATSSYDTAAFLANPGGFGGGTAAVTLHPGGQATQWRQAYNDANSYFRNVNDSGYPAVYMDVVDSSALRYKQDVVRLTERRRRNTPRSSLNVVRQLRPVFYRWRKDQRLIRTDFQVHECNEDCIGPEAPHYSTANTCPQYRSWQAGSFGFAAEDIDELLPEVGRHNAQGEPEGIKTLALVAVLTDALQELIERVDRLERKK
jgi:hypothetical protein